MGINDGLVGYIVATPDGGLGVNDSFKNCGCLMVAGVGWPSESMLISTSLTVKLGDVSLQEAGGSTQMRIGIQSMAFV